MMFRGRRVLTGKIILDFLSTVVPQATIAFDRGSSQHDGLRGEEYERHKVHGSSGSVYLRLHWRALKYPLILLHWVLRTDFQGIESAPLHRVSIGRTGPYWVVRHICRIKSCNVSEDVLLRAGLPWQSDLTSFTNSGSARQFWRMG